MWDVIIVGGGAAGLSAALTLGRMRRRVLVCAAGSPRNAVAEGVHGFLSRDGTPPGVLLAIARDQLQPYDSVETRAFEVLDVRGERGAFEVTLADGSTEATRRVLFATGVVDVLPDIPGLAGLWGRGVFHCPYCHGWEARDQAIAILASGERALHLAALLRPLSRTLAVCTHGVALSAREAELFQANGVDVYEAPIAAVHPQRDRGMRIEFADGSTLTRTALFLSADQRQRAPLAAQLGCAFTERGLVWTDETGQTSVPGIYAAGDLTSPLQQVIAAAAQGARTAAMINAELSKQDFEAAFQTIP